MERGRYEYHLPSHRQTALPPDRRNACGKRPHIPQQRSSSRSGTHITYHTSRLYHSEMTTEESSPKGHTTPEQSNIRFTLITTSLMRKSLLFALLLCISIGVAWAQKKQVTVTGVVIAADDKEPVVAASVTCVEFPSHGVLTDVNGKFTLRLPAEAKTLKVSSIGYLTQTVAITGQELKITLKNEEKSIDKVVVVAYGTQTKNSFTGSAARIDVASLTKKTGSNITSALEGASPGVQVFTTSGQPGAAATVQIRGIGSVNSSTSPLYVIDGVPYTSLLSGFNMADVENLTVLKDASATALYGARAANGVVLITTKQGKAGRLSFDAEIKSGINVRYLPQYDVIDSPEEYMEVAYEAMKNTYERFGLKDKLNQLYTNPNAKFAAGKTIADAPKNAADLLFFPGILAGGEDATGIWDHYNLWKAGSGQMIDVNTGKFNNSYKRLYTPESWRDHIFRTGRITETNVRVSGGSEKVNFSSSLGYQDNIGYYISSEFNRLNLRNNVTVRPTKDFKVSLGLAYSRSLAKSPGQGSNSNNGFQFVNQIPAIYPVFEHDANGNLVNDPKIPGGKSYDYGQTSEGSRAYAGGINPAGAVRLDRDEDLTNLTTGNLNLEYRFLKDFKLAVTYGFQSTASKNETLANPYYGDAAKLGRISNLNENDFSWTLNEILSWGKTFGDHTVDAFIAHEATKNEFDFHQSGKKKLILGNVTTLDDGLIRGDISGYRLTYAIESYFGQARYDYQNKYYLSTSVRRDGSSRFAPDYRWGTFGSVGAAWIISKEKFLSPVKWINNLKLKASYGVLGNQSLNLAYGSTTPNYYLYHDFYEVDNFNSSPSFSFYAKGNSALQWERSGTFNVGFESRLFNALELNVDYFVKTTDNMLFKKQVAPSLGYAYYPVSEGRLRNNGLEVELNWEAYKSKDISVNVRANGGYYKNKMLIMPVDPFGVPKHYELQGNYAYKKGHSVLDYYMPIWKGVSNEGLPMWKAYTYKDASGNDAYVTDYEKYISTGGDAKALTETTTSDYNKAVNEFVGKSAIPDFVGGFGFDVQIKNVNISTNFSYGLGGWGYDAVYAGLMSSGSVIGTRNWHKDIRNYWSTDKHTDLPILTHNVEAVKFANSTSTRFLTSRSFLTLSNARISYDLPKSLMKHLGLNSASVYVSGDNLFLISARKGYAAMTSLSGGSGTNRYLPVSTFVAGARISF